MVTASTSETHQRHLIGGERRNSSSGEVFDVMNPATGARVGTAAKGDRRDAARALEAAELAFAGWAGSGGDERATAVERAAERLSGRTEEMSALLTREHGKPLNDARKEIAGALETFRFYAAEARRIGGDLAPPRSASTRSLAIREPVGVVSAIVPWNYPVSLMAWKVAPALAAGCTVVAKPPSEAPLATTAFLAALSEELPAGVVNVVTGPSSEVGDELVRNPLSRLIALTGSTRTGKEIVRASADHLKRLILELGGHTPLVVFADADMGRAVSDGVKRSFRNAGQICNAVNRILVAREIEAEYLERFAAATAELTLGDGLEDPDVDVGPMVNKAGVERARRHVRDALDKGARLLCGGVEGGEGSCFFPPTALADVTDEMLLTREETFGPVVGIRSFDGFEEAVRLANATDFGLVCYAYTRDLATAFRFSEAAVFGTVAVNTVSPDSLYAPYPARKQSGTGVELGRWGLEEYLETKHVLIELGYADETLARMR